MRAAYVDRYRPVYLAAVERLARLLKQVGTAHDEFEQISRALGPLLPACAPTLKDRLVRLDEKHIFDQSVDRRSYVALRDKLRADLLRAEMAVRDGSLAIVDLDAALAASEHVLSHAADLWQVATLAQRQKLQDALFPSGLAHDGEKFGTVTTCIAFSQLNEEKYGGGEVASPTGFEPVS